MQVIKLRRKRWTEHIGGRGACRGLVGIVEGKKPLERPMHRLEDNTEVDIQGNGMGAWTRLIWLRIWTGGVFL
jgi:hypothetical protein